MADEKYDGFHTFKDGTRVPYRWSVDDGDPECPLCIRGECKQKVILLSTLDADSGNIVVHTSSKEFS